MNMQCGLLIYTVKCFILTQNISQQYAKIVLKLFIINDLNFEKNNK